MELSHWHQIDSETGLVKCWFTHPAIEEIEKRDWSDKVVWVWGAGLGDIWLSKRCKELHVVERSEIWLSQNVDAATKMGITNITYYFRPCNEGSGAQDMYCEIPEGMRPNVFIADDVYRYEAILKALEFKPCTLVVDNFMQAFVFICPSAVEVLKDYKGELYEQADHQDHDGINKWKTGIWDIE